MATCTVICNKSLLNVPPVVIPSVESSNCENRIGICIALSHIESLPIFFVETIHSHEILSTCTMPYFPQPEPWLL